MVSPARSAVAAVGLVLTGVLALSDAFEALPAALAATAAAWWILAEPATLSHDLGDDVFLPPDDIIESDSYEPPAA